MITYVAGVAARDGVLYVCDSLGGCVWRLDYRHGTYSLFGLDGPGRLQLPTDIILTDNASKYVVDAHRKQIVVFGPEDEYTNTFDLPEACNPRDVAAYGQEFYVLCGGEERRIDVLDISSGQLLRTIGERNIASEQFVGACSLCIDSKGFLYVSDGGNQCVQKLTRDGQLVWVKELHGHYEWFRNPVDVRAAPDDAVYWIGAGRPSKIHRYSADGQVHMAFGGPTTVPNPLFGLRVLAIDATSLPYFRDYMHEGFNAEYLLFVADTHDHSVVNIYAFGSFAEGDQRLQ
ncbi:MAG: NHL repeat-containing protein [Phycisphaerae bacterium]|nr:NHL repeat-containing protein [Phycisphaerae bacterium]